MPFVVVALRVRNRERIKWLDYRMDDSSQQGTIRGDDGNTYDFTVKQWASDLPPEVDGSVRAICQNGRDISKLEFIPIEHLPKLEITIFSPDGELKSLTRTKFLGGPWRLRSDALAWMAVAKNLHTQTSHTEIRNISSLLLGVNPLISLRGSVVKYCYGIAIELYMKWILIEAAIPYKLNHDLSKLINKIPVPVVENIRKIYSDYWHNNQPKFKIMEAHVHGVNEVSLDWSSFDKFIKNIDNLKFIVGRYAVPADYSIFQTLSAKLSKEMNCYMDSADFFDLGEKLLSYKPNLAEYSNSS